jgi:hypothetical protein
VLEWLVADPQNCSLHDRNDDGNTALLCATMGAEVFVFFSWSFLTNLLAGGHVEVVAWLLEHGCTVDQRDDAQNSAILTAVCVHRGLRLSGEFFYIAWGVWFVFSCRPYTGTFR